MVMHAGEYGARKLPVIVVRITAPPMRKSTLGSALGSTLRPMSCCNHLLVLAPGSGQNNVASSPGFASMAMEFAASKTRPSVVLAVFCCSLPAPLPRFPVAFRRLCGFTDPYTGPLLILLAPERALMWRPQSRRRLDPMPRSLSPR